jgi:eukaryotic-like serine/threonine-protein kinase
MIGRVVDGRWKIVKAIGRGGMGVVYEGQNVSIGKRVALKFIDAEYASDPEVTGRFQREAKAASAVESTHIVEVFDTGQTEDGRPYLVMELLRGESLRGRIRRLGRIVPDEAAQIVAQTLRGLTRAHAAGVIHRDLKPDNLFVVQRDDDELFVKILDFGISKVRRAQSDVDGHTLTRKGSVLGTPNYMAPEQAQGHADLDERADLFSVGAILFECLTGHPPHHDLTSYEAIIVAMCTKDAPDVRTIDPTIPDALAEIATVALSRDRNKRFASADVFLEALRAAAPGAIPSRRTPFSAKLPASPPVDGDAATLSAGVPGSSSGDPAAGGDPIPTKTSWTSRGGLGGGVGHERSSLPETDDDADGKTGAPIGRRRRLGLWGLLSAAGAFALTLGVLSLREKPESVIADGSGEVGTLGSSSAVPDTSVAVRVVGPPSLRVFADGKRLDDNVLRGPLGARLHLRLEADEFEAREQELSLDHRTELRVDLTPVQAAPAASVSSAAPATTTIPVTVAPPARTPPHPPTTAAVPTKTPPPQHDGPVVKDPGLKLKVDP